MSSAQNQDHLPFMDAARGALMSLGVLLHAANVFSDSSWAIQNAQTSYIFDYMIDLIHLFRMPAFFIVSGFFCHMSLQKYGHRLFISKRVPRILIPMIAVALSLNSLQNFILSQYYTNPFSLLDSNYWLLGKWVSHLWFLHCILFYFAAAALLYKYSLKPLNTVASLFNELILRSKGLYLLILPLATMLTLKLSYLFPDTSYYLYSVGEAVLYSIFFAFGALIGHNRPLLIAFIKPGIITSILVLSILTLHAYFSNSHTLLGNILNLYISHLQTWLLCLACFFIFYTLCNSRSKIIKNSNQLTKIGGYEDIQRRVPDLRNLKKVTNFKPKFSLIHGLKEMIKSYTQNE